MEGRQSGRRSRRRAGTALALAALLALAPALGRAATPEAQIAEIARAARHPDLRWPRFPDYQTVVLALYEPRGFAPLWLEDGRPTAAAAEATRALGGADAQGLAAADYDAARLEAARRELARGARATAETLARFDTGLTLGLLRLVSDLHVGRVDPQRLAFGYDVGPKRYDLAALVAAAVRDGDIARIVAEAPPALGQHRRLVEQLARYRALAADTSVGPVLVRGTLRPGDPSQGTDGLARWLAALGDLPAPSGGDASLVYDGELVEALRRFQARHGLAVDGVIGPATARALAVPAEQRVRQIEWALERLRWIPALPHERAVFVNIPAFELFAVDAVSRDEPAALRMRVVVGRAGTRTPAFTGTLATVVFAPYWNVPRSITVNEQLPKLRRDPGALAGGGFEIARGATVLPATAASVEELAAGRAQLRQPSAA